MARTLGEMIALRSRVPEMDAAQMRVLLTELLNAQMDATHLLSRAEANAAALGRVRALRDRLLSANTWDGRPSLVYRAFGQEIAAALEGDADIVIGNTPGGPRAQ